MQEKLDKKVASNFQNSLIAASSMYVQVRSGWELAEINKKKSNGQRAGTLSQCVVRNEKKVCAFLAKPTRKISVLISPM